MAWSYILCETRTGRRLQTLTPISSGTWGRRLAYKCTGSHDFLLSENPSLGGSFTGPRRTLVVCWDGEPWYAGVLWKRNYSRATGVVTISHADIWSIWERRLAGPQFQATTVEDREIIETRVSYTGSLATHFKRIVQLGMIGPTLDLPEYQLPVILPPDTPGTRWMQHWTYDFLTVSESLSSMMDQAADLAVDFQPEWSSTGDLAWRMQAIPRAIDAELVLSMDSKDSEISDVTVAEDFENHSTEVHATGEGSETGTLHRLRWDQSLAADRVALHHHEAMSEAKTYVELLDRAEGEYQARQRIPQQIECAAKIGPGLPPSRFWIGRTVTIRAHKGDLILAPGDYKRQVIGVTSSGPDEVKLELIPI